MALKWPLLNTGLKNFFGFKDIFQKILNFYVNSVLIDSMILLDKILRAANSVDIANITAIAKAAIIISFTGKIRAIGIPKLSFSKSDIKTDKAKPIAIETKL